MALSGTLQTTATTWTESGITYHRSFLFSWSASQDITANKSTISWNIKLNITNNSGVTGKATVKSCSINVAGTEYTGATGYAATGTVLKSGTTVITHDSSGNASFTVSISGNIGGDAHSKSATFTLDSLVGAATASLASATIGTASDITISYVGATPHHVSVELLDGSTVVQTIASSTTEASIPFTPTSEIEALMTTVVSKQFTLRCKTYSDDTTEIGTTTSTITIDVPASYKPVVSLSDFVYSISIGLDANNMLGSAGTASGTATVDKIGTYNTATASISAATVDFNNKNINCSISENTIVIPTLDNINGTATVTVTATDTRGRSASATKEITVTKYTAPTFTLTAIRTDSANSNTAISSGTFVKATVTDISCQSIGTNSIQSTKITIGDTITDGSIATKETTAEQLVVAVVTDKISSTTIQKTVVLSVSNIPITLYDDKTEVGVGIGVVATAGEFTCNLPAVFNNGITGVNISETDVIDALGFTPYDSTNPEGYTTNTGTITGVSVNGTSLGTSGVVDIKNIPWEIIADKPTNVSSFTNDAGYINGTWSVAWSGTCKSGNTITCTIPTTVKLICASYYMAGYYATLLLPIAEGVLDGSKYMIQADGYAGGTFALSGTTLTYTGTAQSTTNYYLTKIRYME